MDEYVLYVRCYKDGELLRSNEYERGWFDSDGEALTTLANSAFELYQHYDTVLVLLMQGDRVINPLEVQHD